MSRTKFGGNTALDRWLDSCLSWGYQEGMKGAEWKWVEWQCLNWGVTCCTGSPVSRQQRSNHSKFKPTKKKKVEEKKWGATQAEPKNIIKIMFYSHLSTSLEILHEHNWSLNLHHKQCCAYVLCRCRTRGLFTSCPAWALWLFIYESRSINLMHFFFQHYPSSCQRLGCLPSKRSPLLCSLAATEGTLWWIEMFS